MKCECKDYNECVTCIYFDECTDKPFNESFRWVFVYLLALVIGLLILLIN